MAAQQVSASQVGNTVLCTMYLCDLYNCYICRAVAQGWGNTLDPHTRTLILATKVQGAHYGQSRRGPKWNPENNPPNLALHNP